MGFDGILGILGTCGCVWAGIWGILGGFGMGFVGNSRGIWAGIWGILGEIWAGIWDVLSCPRTPWRGRPGSSAAGRSVCCSCTGCAAPAETQKFPKFWGVTALDLPLTPNLGLPNPAFPTPNSRFSHFLSCFSHSHSLFSPFFSSSCLNSSFPTSIPLFSIPYPIFPPPLLVSPIPIPVFHPKSHFHIPKPPKPHQ